MKLGPCSLLFVPLAAVGIARLASALRTGTMETRSGRFEKRDQPGRFRFDAAVLACAVGVCCLMIVGAI